MSLLDIPTCEVDTFIAFANELADAARPLALSYFRTPLDVISKLDESPVTIADRTIEKLIRDMIEARFPTHGIYGEEMGVKEGDDFTWVLDPIDGTKSFITGFPLFGTLISLTYRETSFCGLIDVPATGERWQAKPGQTLFAGKPAIASGCESLSEARFYTTSPDMFSGSEINVYETVSRAARMRRFGGDCYIYGLLASGYCDIALETGLQPYDYMALVPVVEGAGGCITDWQGNPLSIHSDGQILATATPKLHADALRLLRQ
ncbi:histidinol-phosphatase [Agrobacterium rhizogenes]|uniref:histidinol-phosphatase n=1 Tax=Rhizobium rhizogenes TaxID=359 RepID=UPI00055FFF97|nr:histidinol-phosphatase [Rhizobium rhizogenes]NTH16333.1 histidinol-phosphatase [Rhizobium rhizogenes]NTI78090.1 histidinol-phosphatase [Rhizobium rhizogenes]